MPYPHCNKCQEERKKHVTLTFRRAELIYDASNYSFVEADIIPADDEHKRHQVSDIGEEGNVDRVTRVLNTAHTECVEMLYPYTKEEIPDTLEALDDKLTEPEVYQIDLSLPYGFSMTTVRLMENIIHEYLVCRVVADWMSITNPDSEENWEKKFISLRDKLKSALLSRRSKIRRRLSPF